MAALRGDISCRYLKQFFLVNLYIFPLISLRGGVSINRLTLILKIISQCDVKHVIKLQIKTITSVLMILTGITTSIAAHSTRLTTILAIMSCLDLQNY